MSKIPHPILNRLKCVNCFGWLSFGPVKVLPSGKSVCGRCNYIRAPHDVKYSHFAYEALASCFLFPCINWNRNCPQFFQFNTIQKHEATCNYESYCKTFWTHPSAACKSGQRLNLAAAIGYQIIPERILEHLKCFFCDGYLSCAPVTVRKDGKSTCHRCFNKKMVSPDEFIRHEAFEALISTMIFPCVYRFRGCSFTSKFGHDIWDHELNCTFSKVYKKIYKVGGKEKGVVETHTGHIYATLTPHTKPLFAPPQQPIHFEEKGVFLREFKEHRKSLSNKWQNQRGFERQNSSPASPTARKFNYTSMVHSNSTPNFTPAKDEARVLRHSISYDNRNWEPPQSASPEIFKFPPQPGVILNPSELPQPNLRRSESLYSYGERGSVIDELKIRHRLQKLKEEPDEGKNDENVFDVNDIFLAYKNPNVQNGKY